MQGFLGHQEDKVTAIRAGLVPALFRIYSMCISEEKRGEGIDGNGGKVGGV